MYTGLIPWGVGAFACVVKKLNLSVLLSVLMTRMMAKKRWKTLYTSKGEIEFSGIASGVSDYGESL